MKEGDRVKLKSKEQLIREGWGYELYEDEFTHKKAHGYFGAEAMFKSFGKYVTIGEPSHYWEKSYCFTIIENDGWLFHPSMIENSINLATLYKET